MNMQEFEAEIIQDQACYDERGTELHPDAKRFPDGCVSGITS
jgi:hypothetical protein